MILIRKEQPKDYLRVEEVVRKAFEKAPHSNHKEHILVNKLRKSENFIPDLSLVACDGIHIVGHIMFTKVHVGEISLLALAPLAVQPEYQNQGIGIALVKEGIKVASGLHYGGIVVLGDPHFYLRFGFTSANKWGIRPPFEAPSEYFMAREIIEGGLKEARGVVKYSKAFSEV